MLQHPAPFPVLSPNPEDVPAIIRDADGTIVANPRRRTVIWFNQLEIDARRYAYNVTVIHRKRRTHEMQLFGSLVRAMFTTLTACVQLGYLRRVHDGRPHHYHLTRAWSMLQADGSVSYRIGCGCGPHCTRHRPLLTFSRLPGGRYFASCAGRTFVSDNDFTTMSWTFEQLIKKHYLR